MFKNKTLYIVFSSCLVSLWTIVIIYYIVSEESIEWLGALGSLVGGLSTPLLSIVTVLFMLWSFSTQLELLTKQVNEDKRQNRKDELLDTLRELSKQLKEYIMDAKVPIVFQYQYYKESPAFSGKVIVKVDELNGTMGVKAFDEPLYIMRERTVLEFLKEAEAEHGDNFASVLSQIKDQYTFQVLSQFPSGIIYLVTIANDALKEGASPAVINHILGRFCDVAVHLVQWGLLEPDVYLRLKIMCTLPSEVGAINFDRTSLLSKEIQKCGIELPEKVCWSKPYDYCFPNKTGLLTFLKDTSNQAVYIRVEQNNWVKVDKKMLKPSCKPSPKKPYHQLAEFYFMAMKILLTE